LFRYNAASAFVKSTVVCPTENFRNDPIVFHSESSVKWLAKEKDQVIKFLRAFQKGVRYTRDNREEAVKVLRKYVKMDPAVAPAGYDQYRDSFPVDGKIAEKGIAVVIEQEFETGRIKRNIPLDEMVDRSFMTMLGK
jgi:ABC-type nitrate/sulfonate/bicarbonate transport system substrate-binding protein